MRICWDDLEGFYLSSVGTFRKNKTTYYLNNCETCEEEFLGQKHGRFCSEKCRLENHSRSHKGFKHSSDSKIKISEKNKKIKKTDEWKNKYVSKM